jgi:tripartite-type tricarboxylate transporter receptor subunit TctC
VQTSVQARTQFRLSANAPSLYRFARYREDFGSVIKRRAFLKSAAAFAAMPAVFAHAAETWPSRPVTIVVPFGAGGSADLVARIFAEGFQSKFGQPLVVENRGGAGGTIGAGVVAKSANDGYTLLLGTVSTQAINPSLYGHLPYDPDKDFAPISPLVQFPNLLVVSPKLPVTTVADFIAYLKQNDSKLNYGSSGNGTSSHLCAVMLQRAVGVTATHVPFRGSSDEMAALAGGQIDFAFDSMTTIWPLAKAGQVRALAVSSAKRVATAPDIPAIGEVIPGFDAIGWQGVVAPAGTPQAILAKLADGIREIFTAEKVMTLLREVGGAPMPMQPDEFAQFIGRERAKWAEVVKASGAHIE